jgi:hypothetical protein
MSKGKLCKHGYAICSKCVVITDAAKRISDNINLAVTFHTWEECAHHWMAFTLAEGQTDHVLYPSMQDAIDHVPNEHYYCYICLDGCMAGMPPKDAQLWLQYFRHQVDNGFRHVEPKKQLMMPLMRGGYQQWLSGHATARITRMSV